MRRRRDRPTCLRCAPTLSRAGPPCRPGPSRPAPTRCAPRCGWPTDAGDPALRVDGRLVLAEALIHSLRGFDEEGVAALQSRRRHRAGARRPAGRGRGSRRARLRRLPSWPLRPGSNVVVPGASTSATVQVGVTAKATTYLGAVASDQGHYSEALALLQNVRRLVSREPAIRRAAYGVAMLGRAYLLLGELDTAAEHLDCGPRHCRARDHWLSFLPWPQALRGEVQLAGGDVGGAAHAPRAGLRPGLPAGRPVLGGDRRPWTGPGRRRPG